MIQFNVMLSLLMAVLVLSACEKKPIKEKPLPEVFVVVAEEQPYTPSQGYSARIDSRNDVDIMAQVSGKLIKIHFREGDQVKLDAPLFDIDPAPFKATLARAKAELTKSQASKRNAQRNFERGKSLVKDGFISESEFDTLEARKLESEASVEAAKAALDSAQVDLAYTNIKAPQAGRVGRSIPALGDVVSPSYGALTSLVGQDGMDVVFQLPEKAILRAQRSREKKTIDHIEVIVMLADGTEYPHKGRIDYFANRVDVKTATVETRARIDNSDDVLRPGMFVRAILRLDTPLQALMVPQAAVQVDQRGSYVLSVDANNTVVRMNLTTGERIGENVLVNAGLQTGDQVIVRGVQQARAGDKVKVSAFKPATDEHEVKHSD